jgi:hypothetical protein
MSKTLEQRCPKCVTNLVADTDMVLCSNPPQHNATCPNCGYHTYVWCDAKEVTSTKIILEEAERPEDDKAVFPTYHEMLDYMCKELNVPGMQSFWGAVAWIKKERDQYKEWYLNQHRERVELEARVKSLEKELDTYKDW